MHNPNPSAPLGTFPVAPFLASGMGKSAAETGTLFHTIGASPPSIGFPEGSPSRIGDTEQQQQQQQQQDPSAEEENEDSDASAGTPISDTESVSWGVAFQWIVLWANLGYCFYYFGVVWLWTPFQYEYTQMWNSPSPGPFIDYTTGTWTYWVLSWQIFQLFPVPALVYSMVRPESFFRMTIHRVSIAVAAIIDIGVFIFLIFFVWIPATNSCVFPYSIANSENMCCVKYGCMASSYACHNFNPCTDFPPMGQLHANPVFVQHIWAIFVFLLFALMHVFCAAMIYYFSYNSSNVVTRPNNVYNKRGARAIRIIMVVMFLFICLYYTLGILPITLRHTHQFPPSGPYGIRSARGTIEGVGLIMSAVVLFLPILTLCLEYAAEHHPETKAATIAVLAALGVVFAVSFFSFMTMIYARTTANYPGYPNSPANHPLRCCADDTRADPSSQCDSTTIPCTLPLDGFPQYTKVPNTSAQIPYNPFFNLIFGFFVAMLVLQLIVLVLALFTYLGDTGKALAKTVSNGNATINSYIDQLHSFATSKVVISQKMKADDDIVSEPIMSSKPIPRGNFSVGPQIPGGGGGGGASSVRTRFSHKGATATMTSNTED